MAGSTRLSSRSIAGLGGQTLLSTGGGALPCTGAAGSAGALGTQTSGLGPLNRGDSTAGLKLLRYLRFLSVTLPDPSTLMEYLSNPRSSRTTPVLSHLLAKLPAAFWFCMNTCWPEIRFGNALLCSAHFSPPRLTLWRSATSRCSLHVIQVLAGL